LQILEYLGDKKHQELADQLTSLGAAMREHGLFRGGVETPLSITAAQFGVSSSSPNYFPGPQPILSPNSKKKRKMEPDEHVDSSQTNQ
jgi:hypothetical protein